MVRHCSALNFSSSICLLFSSSDAVAPCEEADCDSGSIDGTGEGISDESGEEVRDESGEEDENSRVGSTTCVLWKGEKGRADKKDSLKYFPAALLASIKQ